MTNAQIIKKALRKGMKEYTPSSTEKYDRAWQLKIDDDSFINLNWFNCAKHGLSKNLSGWELVFYRHDRKNNVVTAFKTYDWRDFNVAWREIERVRK